MFTSKFNKLKKILGKKFGSSKVATAQKKASEDPKKFAEKMKNADIKKIKGVAF